MPAVTIAAPAIEPMRACDEDVGSARHHVNRFHAIAPARPARSAVRVSPSVEMSPPMVVATATELNAPMISSTAAAATASRGRIAPLATDVATALAALVEAVREIEQQGDGDDDEELEGHWAGRLVCREDDVNRW